MTAWGLTINLRTDEDIQIYRRLHENQIPEIHAPGGALDVIGVKTMRIFFMKPRALFMYMETRDDFVPWRDFGHALELHPKVKEFDDYVHGNLLERVAANDGPTEWAVMEPIYIFDKRDDLQGPFGQEG